MTVKTIYKLLEKLEDMILKGIPVPLTPWVVVPHEKIIDTIDKIVASIPGEIQEAHGIIKKSEDIIQDANKKANQIIAEAKRQAEIVLSDSELLKAVESEALKIRQQVISDCEIMKKQALEEVEQMRRMALDEAVGIRDGADKYAESVLNSLDRDLTELHGIVKNGQRHLANVKAEYMANYTAQRNGTNKVPPQIAKQNSSK